MSEDGISPTAEQIEMARRLMTGAQIATIRLLQGFASHTPQKPPKDGETLEIQMKATPRGALGTREGHREMRVLVEYLAEARRKPALKPEIAIRATFELVYQLPADLSPKKSEVRSFAHTNAMLNSFPYWREYVQSSVARMNLPPLVLPLFRITPPAQHSGKKQVQDAKTTHDPKKLRQKGV